VNRFADKILINLTVKPDIADQNRNTSVRDPKLRKK